MEFYPYAEYTNGLSHYVKSVWSWWRGERRKLMALFTDYTGYFDDSGHETHDFLVCGGLVLDVSDPKIFEDEWHQAIAPLPYLHTTNYIAGDKDFKAWKNAGLDSKRELLARAAGVIAKHGLQTFSAALVMADYRRINDEAAFSEFLAYPFSLCARFASVQVQQWATSNGMNDRIKMVFEHRAEGEGEVCAVFERDKLPLPSFEGKDVCALQAADLIAWTNQGKTKNSLNYQRIGKAVEGSLITCLHVRDVINYADMRRMLRLGSGDYDLRRSVMKGGVAFRTMPKYARPKFKK